MRTFFVCALLSLGLGACADKAWPPWLPAPVSDDPEALEIMGGTEPKTPYLLQPYPPQRPWSWSVAAYRPIASARHAQPKFDAERVSRKLDRARDDIPSVPVEPPR
ncbi:MAG: hypothetical protein AB7L90_14910 [Hyphomicrobiaceae bacterium]